MKAGWRSTLPVQTMGVDAGALHVLLESRAPHPALGPDEDGEHVPGGVEPVERASTATGRLPKRSQRRVKFRFRRARLSGSFWS